MGTTYLLLCICLILIVLLILFIIGFILMLYLYKRRKARTRARFRPSYEVDTTFQTEAGYDNRGYPGNSEEIETKVENEKKQIRKSEKKSQNKSKNEILRTENEEQREQTMTKDNIREVLSAQSDQVKFEHDLPTADDNAQVESIDSSRSVHREGKHESNTNITSL